MRLMRRLDQIKHVQLKVGLEVHVELSTRTKMFAGAPSPASREISRASRTEAAPAPNTLIDPVVLGLPGALPVMNLAAVELSMMVGMALGCRVAEFTKWDRKGYFYPDLPKNYQISQYELPLCFDGSVELPPIDCRGEIDWEAVCAAPAIEEQAEGPGRRRIGIIRAHLEEDAGKLMHESPGGGGGGGDTEGSIVDYNRAGTPLLEIVTQPDFRTAEEVVVFAQVLRQVCRFVDGGRGATEGVMQKGHIRFEPNINTVLTLEDGRTVATPIVEVKNLNSFKSLRGAIEFELREQPGRWVADGRELGRGMKITRGWDDVRAETFVQREKEDADDYRYFPDPDLVPVVVSREWSEAVRARIGELPLSRAKRYATDFSLGHKDCAALIEDGPVSEFFDAVVRISVAGGVEPARAGKAAANLVLQSGQKRANERTRVLVRKAQERGESGATVPPVLVSDLGITPEQAAGIIALRESGGSGGVSAQAADEVFGLLCSQEDEPGESAGRGGSYPPGARPEDVARERGLLIVRNEKDLEAWCEQAITADAKSAADVRAGKVQAVGRLVGAVMKLSAGKADAAEVRSMLLGKLGGAEK